MKTTKQFLLTVLSGILLMLMSTAGVPAQTQPSAGDGSVANPYRIGTADEFRWWVNHVNGGNTTASARLTADITFTNMTVNPTDGTVTNRQTTQTVPTITQYEGTFDGGGHCLSGLCLNSHLNTLFRLIGPAATVKNLYLRNVLTLSTFTGILCYKNEGIIDNCHVEGKSTGVSRSGGFCNINSAANTGNRGIHRSSLKIYMEDSGYTSVTGIAGGFCQDNQGLIEDCVSEVTLNYTVSGALQDFGFFAGKSTGSLKNCVALGNKVEYTNSGGGGRNYAFAVDKTGNSTDCYVASVLGIAVVKTGNSTGITRQTEATIRSTVNIYDGDGINMLNPTEFQQPTLAADGYYEIANAAQLAWFRNYVNTANAEPYKTASARLAADINLAAVCGEYKGSWTPIAKYTPYAFATGYGWQGVFDGNGKRINGLYISDLSGNFQALFGMVEGSVKNLTVQGQLTTGNTTALVVSLLGGNGTMEYCTAEGSVNGSATVGGIVADVKSTEAQVSHCTNQASVTGGSSMLVGGIAGSTSGTISHSLNYGAVTGLQNDPDYPPTSYIVGGIAGAKSGKTARIEHCANMGMVSAPTGKIGGIVGRLANGTIANCYNVGAVTSGADNATAHSVIGFKENETTSQIKITFVNNYYLSGDGLLTDPLATAKTAQEFASGSVARLLNGGDGTTETPAGAWGQTLGTDNTPTLGGTPVYCLTLGTEKYYGNTGATVAIPAASAIQEFDGASIYVPGWSDDEGTPYTASAYTFTNTDITLTNGRLLADMNANENKTTIDGTTYYNIDTPKKLQWFAYYVNIANAEPYKTASARLTANIDLATVCGANVNGAEINWTPIAKSPLYTINYGWQGTFDGNGKRISGLYINAPEKDKQGLFGYMQGNVRNLTVQGTVKGAASLGLVAALVGQNAAVEHCTAEGSVSGEQYVGGITGDIRFFNSHVSFCMNNAAVTGSFSYVVGGIAGAANGSILHSVNYGSVTGTRTDFADATVGGIVGIQNDSRRGVENCANLGNVSCSHGNVGGIVGLLFYGSLSNCLNAGTVTSNTDNAAAHSVVGGNNNQTVTNCYYISGEDLLTDPLATAKTAEELASGVVARLLNGGNGMAELPTGAWGQNTSSDYIPQLGGAAVYCLTLGTDKHYGNTGMEVPIPAEVPEFVGSRIYTGGYFDSEGNPYTASAYTFTNEDFALTAGKLIADMDAEENKTTIDGTTYYNIDTAKKLQWFEYFVNTANDVPFNTASARLTADIDLSTVCGADINGTKISWTPIAQPAPYAYDNGWRGTFDGNGHSISGLYIDEPKKDNQGLFGYVQGTLKNLTVQGQVNARRTIGLLASLIGQNATVEYCTAEGSISGEQIVGGVVGMVRFATSRISYCANHASVTGSTSYRVGGIAGSTSGTVSRSVNYGNIAGTKTNFDDSSVGGITGVKEGTGYGIENCVNLGSVNCSHGKVGGIVGSLWFGSLSNSLNAGTVTSNTDNTKAHSVVGGNNNQTVTNCYYISGEALLTDPLATAKTAEELTSGIVARLLNGSDGTTETAAGAWGQTFGTDNTPLPGSKAVYRLTAGENKLYGNTGTEVSLPKAPLAFDAAKIYGENWKDNDNNQYTDSYTFADTDITLIPALFADMNDPANRVPEGEDNYYLINSAPKLAWFSYYVNTANEAPYKTASARLTADIDLSTVCGVDVNGTEISWTPIAKESPYAYNDSWRGTFDGNGKHISGLYINAPGQDTQGLFGYMHGKIKNLTVKGTVKGRADVGLVAALLGQNALVEYCIAEGSVSGTQKVGGVAGDVRWETSHVSYCVNQASVTGSLSYLVGGIAGTASGSILRSVNYGSVTGTRTDFDDSTVGGIVGSKSGLGSDIKDCVNLGQVNCSHGNVGGIVGRLWFGSLSNCFNARAVISNAGNTTAHSVVGSNNGNTITNCYYQSGDGLLSDPLATAQTADELKSGATAWLLNGSRSVADAPWGQRIQTTGVGDLQPMLLFAEPDNILKKEDDGNYSCASLLLDSNNSFYSPEDFTAHGVSFAKDFTGGNYDAFILPVAIPVSQIKGNVYRLQEVNHTTKEFIVAPVNTGSIEANVPYIVKTTESGSLFDPMPNTLVQGKSSTGSLTLTVPGAEFTGIYMSRSFDQNGERRYCKLLPDGTLNPTPYTFYMGTFGAVISLPKPVSEGDYSIKIDAVVTPGENPWPEDFESATKASYDAAAVMLTTGEWQFNDALLGSDVNDKKNNIQSVRIQGSGSIWMNFDKPGGAGSLTLYHANYGSDTGGTLILQLSVDGGSNWVNVGDEISSTGTLSASTFVINQSGNVRFRVNKTGGNRVNIDDILITDYSTVPASSTWWGNSSSEWRLASNWSHGTPGASTSVTIAASPHQPEIHSDVSVGSLTLEPLASLTVHSGKTLHLSGNLTLQSSAVGTATLVDHGTLTVSGTTTVEQYLTAKSDPSASDHWWYISSPVSGATSGSILVEGSSNKLGSYDESAAAYPQITATDVPLGAGRGYLAQINTTGTYTFSGPLTTGDVTVGLTRTPAAAGKRGFNLVGNPYPSHIRWNAITGFGSGSPRTDIRPTVWIRTRTASGAMDFDTFDGEDAVTKGKSGAFNGYIAPLQAFWVKVHTDNTTPSITFSNSMRSAQDQGAADNRLRAGGQSTRRLLRLELSNGVNFDQTLISTNANAQNSYDFYDSDKLSAATSSIPELYSLVEGRELVIDKRRSIDAGASALLGFRPGAAGTFTLKAIEKVNLDHVQVILRDHHHNTETELRLNESYSFSSDATATSSRFSIEFRAAGITSVEEVTSSNTRVYVAAARRIAVESAALTRSDRISVYNLAGEHLLSQEAEGAVTVLSPSFAAGVYLVKVKDHVQKIIVNY